MLTNIKHIQLLICLVGLSACAENTAYNTAQRSAQVECNKEPNQELYQRCMKNNSMPYREYKAEKNQP
ncbi:MAG TPA: hypothetical protein PK129_12780 [Cellvibrionaceae bacterium]|nr:hypothetical protein [Cellvibrionaceae bacterium]